jgi:ATP-dependent DNA ligase
MVWRDGERMRLFTRRGFDSTQCYPWIVHSARRLRTTRFLIDGEVVVCGEDGVADFARLHSHGHDASACLCALDLLAVDGADTRRQQLDHRRAQLRKLLARPDGSRFSEDLGTATARSCSGTLASSGSKASYAAAGQRLPLGPQQGLAEGQEPGEPGGAAVPRG